MLMITKETSIEHDAGAARPSFRAGDAVVVRLGIADPDFSDMSLDGWVGTIVDVTTQTFPAQYLVQWNQSTLERLPLTYHQRCQREDMVSDQMWLFEDDLDALSARDNVGRRRVESAFRFRPVHCRPDGV